MSEKYIEKMQRTSYLSGGNMAYVEDLYEAYLNNESSIDKEWRDYFKSVQNGSANGEISHASIREHFLQLAQNQQPVSDSSLDHEIKQMAVLELVEAFRMRGHQEAKIDPLSLMKRTKVEDLTLAFHGLSDADLNAEFQPNHVYFRNKKAKLSDIINSLKRTYCGSIGAEFMHIVDSQEKRWFQERLEVPNALA